MKNSFVNVANNCKELTLKFASLSWKLTKIYSFFYVAKNYVLPVDLVVCRGASMEPVLNNYDIVLTEKVSVRRKHLKRNDIVIATSPLNSKVNICKRVHRIGGEICDGYTDAEMVVPYGYVYLVGENSKVSRDSNEYGAIPYGLIQSRVLVKIWPLTEFKLFPKK